MIWPRSGLGQSRRLRITRLAAALVSAVLLAVACSGDDDTTSVTTPANPPSTTTPPTTTTPPSTTEDPVAAGEARVATAEADLAGAEDALTSARQQFCTDSEVYIRDLDRYGKLLTDGAATVGDVTTAGADLVAPRESVTSAASAVSAAQSDVEAAAQDVADAQAALAEAWATAASLPVSTTTPPSTTTTTIVPPATIARVEQAEAELASTAEGITDATPLSEATAEYNSAAFALEVAWLRLFADAGCLTDEQQAEALARVTDYTMALQTQLQQAGYYEGELDGIYGPLTVDAVKQLQTDSGLRPTGYADAATQRALDDKLAELGRQAAEQALTQTAALQTVLTLAGYWTGPIDGNWTDELTTALRAFQTALGVEPTGAVDAATLAALQQALSTSTSTTRTSTTGVPSTTAAPATTTPHTPASINTTATATTTS